MHYSNLAGAFFALLLPVTTQAAAVPSYATRSIAGVSVVDTPIVRAAQAFAQAHSADFAYKHIMRSWLFGALIVRHNTTLQGAVDLELQAVAALLHDLGWDRSPASPFVTPDRRFEVDGAFAARDFVLGNKASSKAWDERRVQLLWDSIALHTEPAISYYKELVVATVSKGIQMDFAGPAFGVTQAEYAAVLRQFPNADLKKGVNETIIWLCQTKPASTYNNWQQEWGQYVGGYEAEAESHKLVNVLLQDLH
ncbi:hypothetical protein B0T26DRAFT_649868 [Lasiosphaeria miniovina]|uniref:HD domain-containing protein n=1 Tax=Lasiosphaeria miniovina TaxID=1954250 RepID=A0AA40AAL4_9PEZI|nr:uncharacterized protein B0T26DRAFT_649868 [Lasiosphaeria miniovina]KAK0712365.1 hypothetical protein B0T26DRAFT_649868 [Lasiosphaeria miniovina]